MPQRHSKNNNDRGHFTYEERRRLGFGTQKERLGKDSIKPFDGCCLCIQTVIDPLCCKQGHVFCKECIYSCLLAQKKDIKRKLASFESQSQNDREEAAKKVALEREKQLLAFDRQNHSATPAADEEARRKLEVQDGEKDFQGANSVKTTAFEEEAVRTMRAYWLPSATPEAVSRVDKPVTDTLCPQGGEKLRLKDLIPMTFTDLPGAAAGVGTTGDARFMCPSCSTTLTNTSKLSALSPCGHVLCRKCVEKFVLKDKACPTCSKACSKKEIVELEHGGTGFCAHGDPLVARTFKVLGSGPSAGPSKAATRM